MVRGPKASLGNVALLDTGYQPDQSEPTEEHILMSAELRPRGLRKEERKIWDSLGPQLVMLGRLKPHFAFAFEQLCQIQARLEHWRNKLDDEEWEYVTHTRNGTQIKMRPMVGQLNDDWRKWRSLVGEFGLAPAAERGMKGDGGQLPLEGWGDL